MRALDIRGLESVENEFRRMKLELKEGWLMLGWHVIGHLGILGAWWKFENSHSLL